MNTGRQERLDVTDANALRNNLKRFLSGDGPYWPVVKSVTIEGPFQGIPQGLILIDLPGVNDPNEAREEVTRNYLKDAPFIWVVFNMKRGVTKDIRNLLLEQKLLRRLLLEGKVNALTLIGTHADEFSDDVIDELGLPEDAETVDILRARNREVIELVKGDLLDIASQLAAAAKDGGESFNRLKQTLSATRIFTVSTPAFMKLNKIGIHRKDYGIENATDTGVPDLLNFMRGLVAEQGIDARVAEMQAKLDTLLDEMVFFFRGQQKVLERRKKDLDRQRDDFRSRLEVPRKELATELDQTKEHAEISFQSHKEFFHEKIKIAVSRAIVDLNRYVDSWSNLHWATLKAIIVRNGIYFSPSKERRFDLNAEIAEPLLAAIPFAWDDFFGMQIEKILEGLRGQLEKHGEIFLMKIATEAKIAQAFDEDTLRDVLGDVELSRNNLKFQIEDVLNGFKRTIHRVRIDLSSSITETIETAMRPAYETAKQERGPGMKKRMLQTVHDHALKSSRRIFEAIEKDLMDGVTELGLQFTDQLGRLTQYVEQQANRVLHNIGVSDVCARPTDVDSALGRIRNILASLEGMARSRDPKV